MSEADVRMRSLKAKLRAVTVLLFLVSGVLIALNVYLLSGMRGNAGQPGLHVLEQRAGGLGAPKFQRQLVLGGRQRARYLQPRERPRQDVLAGLVEELIG